MEINENYIKCFEKIFSESSLNNCERLHPEKGYAMPLLSEYNGNKYILTSDYTEKYMSFDEFVEFYRKRSMKDLIKDAVYVEYNGLGLNDLMKDDPEKPIKDWTNEALIRKGTVKYD